MQAIQVQELGQGQGGPGRDGGGGAAAPPPSGVSISARAAQRVLQAVHTFVALTQLQQVSVSACCGFLCRAESR